MLLDGSVFRIIMTCNGFRPYMYVSGRDECISSHFIDHRTKTVEMDHFGPSNGWKLLSINELSLIKMP